MIESKEVQDTDDLRLEVQADYRASLGRWARATLKNLDSQFFGAFVQILRRQHRATNEVMVKCNALNPEMAESERMADLPSN